MEDTGKYLIHATFVADGVIERSDVVGAVFGQTEGLLGDELELRDLQETAKLGRIDVEVESQAGTSRGQITIASSLDRVETATLAAALEAIERIGPSRATVEVERIQDVRAAKRREIVERAKELLATAFDEGVMDSRAILEEVRESIRVEDITEYEGLPAGPHVERSDAIIVVEGRADVLNLLRYGIKNAIAVEGTDVPESVAALTAGRTVTAFLDGDRGGDLIRRELDQVGDLDYVALTPPGKSVEDLSREEVHVALRDKMPVEAYEADQQPAIPNGSTEAAMQPAESTGAAPETTGDRDGNEPDTDAMAGGPGSVQMAEPTTSTAGVDTQEPETETDTETDRAADTGTDTAPGTATDTDSDRDTDTGTSADPDSTRASEPGASGADRPASESTRSLADHVGEVAESETIRLLDDDLEILSEAPAADAFEALRDADPVPRAAVLDGAVTQRLVDVTSQRGIGDIVGASTGEFVKQPTSVRVRTFDEIT